jgi:hypothetical protein
MKYAIRMAVIALAVAAWGSPAAFADSDKDDSKGRQYYGSEYKEKYRLGDCEIKREWKKDGKYKEKAKCKEDHRPLAGAIH